MKCPKCGKESFDIFCPFCGEKLVFDTSKRQKPKKLFVGFGIIALVCLIVVVVLVCRCNHDNCNVLSDYHNATCKEHMITHYKCLDCGEEWDKEEKQFGNHNFVNYIEIRGATCTEKGLGEETCSVCGKKQTVKPDALGHKWEMSNVITEATCATVGEAEYTCSVCHETENREIPLTDHIEGEWVVTKEATETEAGVKTLYCAVCNAELKRETYTATPEEIKQGYINKCNTYTYSEIARNPENYIGKFAKIKGKVIQVMEDGDDYTLRVNITPGKYIWSDTILVSYTKQNTLEDHILEDDIVTMYGMLSGTYTYESVLGAAITVPLLLAKYIDIG